MWNQSRTKVLQACRDEARSSAQIAHTTGIDVIYVRTILRDFKNSGIVVVNKPNNSPGNTGYTYKVKNPETIERLIKDHEPRALMQVLGVWI